jgi:ribosomal protein L29
MKAKDLRSKSIPELKAILKDGLLQNFKLRLGLANGGLSQNHLLKISRRLIARVETILAELSANAKGKSS